MGRLLVALLLLVTGCETGTEIAIATQAQIRQGPTGGVFVLVTLGCVVSRGMPRGDGNCDADGQRICVEARWFGSDAQATDPTARPLLETTTCERVPHIKQGTIQLSFPGLPDAARTVHVVTTSQHLARNEPDTRGVIVTR